MTNIIKTKTLIFSLMFLLAFNAQAQPTLSAVFTPNSIGPGSNSTLTLTITNSSGTPVTGLTLTNVLPVVPGPLTIADPANIQSDCDLGVSGTLTAPDSGDTITLTDAQIAASQSCTIKVAVTAATPGAHTNPAVTLSSSAGSSMSLPVDLTVVTTLPGFSKSFTPSNISLGEKSTLTFTFDNTLNASRVGNLDLTDIFPVGMVVASPSNTSTDCISASNPNTTIIAVPGNNQFVLDASGSNIFAGFEVLPAGSICTASLDVLVTGAGSLDNQSSPGLADFTSVGFASDTLEVTVTPLAIIKEFIEDPIPPGGSVNLGFTITNRDRNSSASGVAFTDDLTSLIPALAGLTFNSLLSNDCGGSVLGAGTTSISLTGGTIAAEGTCNIIVSLDVPAATIPGAYENTTSAVTATVNGSPIVGNTASDDLFIEPVPLITKTFVGDPVDPGDPVVLDFTLTNTSTTSAATDVAFSDVFDSIMPTASLTPGNDCCGIGSTCTFTPLIDDPNGTIPARFSLTGGTLTPAGMAGDSCTFSITLDVSADAPTGIYPNMTTPITATVDGETRTGLPATDDLVVIAAPSLSKSFVNDPVAPGGTVTLEFTLSHSENATTAATNITFTDDLVPVLAGLTANFPPTPDPPCGAGSSLTGSAGDTLLTLMGGNLLSGESCTFSVTLDVPVGAAPGAYTNTTSGVSATVMGLPASSAPAIDDLNVSGLVFTKEYLDDPVIAGDTVTLRFAIDNIHPTEDATITFFTDTLSASLPGLAATGPATVDTCGGALSGTTTLIYVGGSVLSGQSCTIEVDVLVPPGAADGQFTNITSSLSATQGGVIVVDPAVDVLVVNSNLLQLTKTFTNDPVAAGSSVLLDFTLTNLDVLQAASAIDFSDDLGAALTGLTFDSLVSNNCGATVSGLATDMITVTNASLPAAGSCLIQVNLTVPAASNASIYTNTTSALTGMIGGFSVTGDPASDDLEVIELLLFSKAFDAPTTATGLASLTFTITNPGANTVDDISFNDDLDSVITGLIATSLPAVPCGMSSNISGVSFLAFTGGSLAPMGGTCSFTVDVLVPATATGGSFPNVTSDLTVNGLKYADPATANLIIESAPTFTKAFAPDTIGVGQTSQLLFTIDNSASALVANGLDFTDNLPAGVLVDVVPAVANTCGGTVTAVASSATISLTGGTVAAGAICTIQVSTISNTPGMHTNTTGDLTSSSGNSGTATATLMVNPQPGFSKVFAPNPILVGDTSTLVFTIDNVASTVDASSLDFTDNLPTNMIIATPSNAATTCTGGTLTAADGTSVITYTGGLVAMANSCTVSVDITTITAGSFVNTSGNLTSSLGNSGVATDTLSVNPPPSFVKLFNPDVIIPNGTSQLSFTIDNTGSTIDATALDFTDNFPANLIVATPNNSSNTCNGGTLTATAGTAIVSYTGGTVNSNSSCVITVDVTSTMTGNYVNTTGDLTSSHGNSGMASDSILVAELPMFSKAFANNTVLVNTANQLTFMIDNTSNAFDVMGLAFTDNLPAGMEIANPANVSNTCSNGTLNAVSGGMVIDYSSGTVSSSTICTISVDVIATTIGDYVNTTTALVTDLGTSGIAMANMTAVEIPVLTKSFAVSPINSGNDVELIFDITNNNTIPATLVSFTDDLDAFITGAVASNLPQNDVCGVGSTLTGNNVISLSNATLAAGSSCQFSVMVTIPLGTLSESYQNVTSALSVELDGQLFIGLAGSEAAADLMVIGTPIVIPLLNNWLSLLMLIISMLFLSKFFLIKRTYK